MRMMRSPVLIGLPIHSDGSSSSATPLAGDRTRERCNCSRRKSSSARFSSILPCNRASWGRYLASSSACWLVWRNSASAVASVCSATWSLLWISTSSKPNSGWPFVTTWLGWMWKVSTTPSSGARTTTGCAGTSSPGASTVRRTGKHSTTRTTAAHRTRLRCHHLRSGSLEKWRFRRARPARRLRTRGWCRAWNACHQVLVHSRSQTCTSSGHVSSRTSSKAATGDVAGFAAGVASRVAPSGAGMASHSAWVGHHSAHSVASASGKSSGVSVRNAGLDEVARCRNSRSSHWA